MKSKLIGHNKPPRTHNYPKNRKPPRKKTPLDPDGEKKIQKILKRKERKVKIKARDITWISY